MQKSPHPPQIVSCTGQLALFEKIAVDFFQEILGMNYDEVLVCDSARLSDFSLAGDFCQELNLSTGLSVAQIYDAWDSAVLDKIERVYGFRPADTSISVYRLLQALQDSKARTLGTGLSSNEEA
jgi:hypothetical protein